MGERMHILTSISSKETSIVVIELYPLLRSSASVRVKKSMKKNKKLEMYNNNLYNVSNPVGIFRKKRKQAQTRL